MMSVDMSVKMSVGATTRDTLMRGHFQTFFSAQRTSISMGTRGVNGPTSLCLSRN